MKFDQAKKSIKIHKFCSQISIEHKSLTDNGIVEFMKFGTEKYWVQTYNIAFIAK